MTKAPLQVKVFFEARGMEGEWQVVSSRRRPVHVKVYKENATGIHYILFKGDIEIPGEDDCIPARAVVELTRNHFVFVDGHYSSEGDLCVKNFDKNYTFVRTLDLSKITTESFEDCDPRVVSCVYSVRIS